VVTIGGIFLLFLEIIKNFFKASYKEITYELYSVGVQSLPIIFMTGVFVGTIMVIQTGFYVRAYNITEVLGWGAGFTGFREVAPLMVGLMFSGRIGANNTAELASMKVTEQLDALKILTINPITYIIIPRFIAIVIMITLLTIIADFMTIISGLFTAKLLLGMDYHIFLDSFFSYIKISDFTTGLAKSFVFGIMISLVSSYYGLNAKRSSKEIGFLVNKSVVFTAISIFLIDYVLTSIFEL
jgi:phospholipid/cholesterol/gamma-HCH transport system permease protein